MHICKSTSAPLLGEGSSQSALGKEAQPSELRGEGSRYPKVTSKSLGPWMEIHSPCNWRLYLRSHKGAAP